MKITLREVIASYIDYCWPQQGVWEERFLASTIVMMAESIDASKRLRRLPVRRDSA
eukprot:CAMPEP_0113238006 /NCGR_PEP_ID=MMETSP0008_2-20120614/4925_1 /TAXON_ID=97485 /ORGANISM="Prymnesium parvum" /LENGTH=55 /DNA_ID=CAMNT_0000085103 /DNA_START=179 /DNA_END=346 /DNA_ORIENTATION=- /assembly_acc=CAM_ASM_000153